MTDGLMVILNAQHVPDPGLRALDIHLNES